LKQSDGTVPIMQGIYRRWEIFLVLNKYGLNKQYLKKKELATEITYSRETVSRYYGLHDLHVTFTVRDTNCSFQKVRKRNR